MYKEILLKNGTREEAMAAFEKGKKEIEDLSRETIHLRGIFKGLKETWEVFKLANITR